MSLILETKDVTPPSSSRKAFYRHPLTRVVQPSDGVARSRRPGPQLFPVADMLSFHHGAVLLRQGLPIATCCRTAPRTQQPVLRRCRQPSARANPAAPFPVKEPEYTPKQTALRAASAVMVGVTGGTVGALIGAGGGIAVTPLLTALLSLQQHAAHGTALAAVTVTACAGAARYAAAGQVAPSAAAMIAASAMVFSPVGARFAGRLDAPRLKAWFGWFLVVVSVAIPALPSVLASAPGLMIGVWGQRVVLVCVGVVTGFLSGLLGIGGGTVAVPAMVLLTGLSQKTAQGTALLAMILPSLLGAITHWRLGNVRLALLPGLALGAVLGGSLGGSVAVFLPETYLRVICSVIFGLIGVRYIRQSRNKLAPDSAETKSHGRAVSTSDQPIRKGDTDPS